MDLEILQRELNELENTPTLYECQNFQARKEALDFLAVIANQDVDFDVLQEQAQGFAARLLAINESTARDWYTHLMQGRFSPQAWRAALQAYSTYRSGQWGQRHYGYENIDFLLDEIFLPAPHPQASLARERGMVRYQPTPASVILELSERIDFQEQDVFCDLGSGLGKVTALVHVLTGVRALGVEYQPDFCAYAAAQAQRLALMGVSYLNADARCVDYAEMNVFFLFNPFGGDIFPAVFETLHQHARRRPIRVASYGASSAPLANLDWLQLVPPSDLSEFALCIFQSVP